MKWYDVFAVWYIGCFEILFGVMMVWKGQALSTCRRFFMFELRDPHLKDRFAAVIDKRNELEGDNTAAWRITGLFSILFGVLVLVHVTPPVIGYALLCAALAMVMSQVYLQMRNRSARRAASLTPRTAYSAVPALWYVGAVVSAILPVGVMLYVPEARYSAVLTACACAAIVIVAARTSEMAALIAGDDPDIEVYVDNRLRWSRVTGLLALAYAASYVYIAMTGPSFRHSPPALVAINLFSTALALAFGVWAAIVYFQGRKRAKVTNA